MYNIKYIVIINSYHKQREQIMTHCDCINGLKRSINRDFMTDSV